MQAIIKERYDIDPLHVGTIEDNWASHIWAQLQQAQSRIIGFSPSAALRRLLWL